MAIKRGVKTLVEFGAYSFPYANQTEADAQVQLFQDNWAFEDVGNGVTGRPSGWVWDVVAKQQGGMWGFDVYVTAPMNAPEGNYFEWDGASDVAPNGIFFSVTPPCPTVTMGSS